MRLGSKAHRSSNALLHQLRDITRASDSTYFVDIARVNKFILTHLLTYTERLFHCESSSLLELNGLYGPLFWLTDDPDAESHINIILKREVLYCGMAVQ